MTKERGRYVMKNTIICIGRQYGSGGREIAEKLAQKLGVVCYDKLLLKKAAEDIGLPIETVEGADEKPIEIGAMISGNVFADTASISTAFYSERQVVYEAQKMAINDVAKKGNCVIVGRCASSILKNADVNLISVFVYAEKEDKVNRIARRNNIDKDEAKKKMQKIDKMRRKYFDFYSDTPWGEPESYDLMISSSKYGIDGTVKIIESALNDSIKEK